MKKRHLPFMAALFLLALSCQEISPVATYSTADEILGTRDFVVHDGMLTFRDRSTFLHLLSELEGKSAEELDEWENSIGFKSLRSLHEEAIRKEEAFLEQMEMKYPNNSTLTRKGSGVYAVYIGSNS